MTTTKSVGTLTVDPSETKIAVITILFAETAADILPDGSFYVVIEHLKISFAQVSKHEKLVKLTEESTIKINMVDKEETVEAGNEVEFVNTVREYKGKKSEKELAEKHDKVTTANIKTLRSTWRKQLSFNDKDDEYRQAFKAMND